jgi:limonene-1,2-epoxide hydrolase
MAADLDAALARYVAALEALDASRVAALTELVTPDVRFRDPFSDVRGAERMLTIFRRLFEDCTDVRFKAEPPVRSGDRAYVSWVMDYRLRRFAKGPLWRIEGASEIRLAPDGRVASHVDHWDAASQFYERLPVLGAVLRAIRRRVAVT